jgi:uncharacterized pyridoxamine 5'-phosphate oxidase family protein
MASSGRPIEASCLGSYHRFMSSIPDTYRTPHGLTADLRRLLTSKSSVALGTINPDGSPHMTYLLFSLDDSDRMYLPTPRTTRKVKNIRERPEVTALVDLEPGWVSCSGHARIVEGSEAAELNHTVYDSILTEGGRATIGRFLEAHEDTTIEITPSKWLSWQMNPIFAWFEEHGIDPGNPSGWMADRASQ